MKKTLLSVFPIEVVFFLALVIAALLPFGFSHAESPSEIESDIRIELSEAEKVVMGGTVEIGPQEYVKKLVVIGGTAHVRGHVEELVVIGGYLKLHEGAEVSGDLVLLGGYMDRDPSALVKGKLVNILLPVSEEGWKEITKDLKKRYLESYLEEYPWLKYLSSFIKIFILLCFAAVGWFFAPGLMRRTSRYLKQNLLWCAVIGIGTTLLILPITMFLILSLVGIPLLPLQFSLLILFVIYGEIHIASWITHGFIGKGSFSFLGTSLGLVFLESLSYLPFGGILKWFFILVGVGATSRVFNQRLLAKLNDDDTP